MEKVVDILFGQNWIGQFSDNVNRYPLPYGLGARSSTQLISVIAQHPNLDLNMATVVFWAFVWGNTPQHTDDSCEGPWQVRRDNDYNANPLCR